MSNMYIHFDCPYCGKSYTRYIEASDTPSHFVFMCETEDGGCNRKFAVEYRARPVITVYEMTGVFVGSRNHD